MIIFGDFARLDSSRAKLPKWPILRVYYKRAKMAGKQLGSWPICFLSTRHHLRLVLCKRQFENKNQILEKKVSKMALFWAFCKDYNSRPKSPNWQILKMNFKTPKTTEEEYVGIFSAKCAGASGIVIILFMTQPAI